MAAATNLLTSLNYIPFQLQYLGPKPTFQSLRSRSRKLGRRLGVVDEQQQGVTVSFTEEENSLIQTIVGVQGRGRSASPQQLIDVERAVKVLEQGLQGVPEPTNSSLIEGRWQLMFTTRPGTASLIQRTFVGINFFNVFQEVNLRTNDPRITNIVKFSDAIGELKVEAAASIKDGKRILFQFDRAAFSFKFLPFKVPYPVPFRLLGDEAKGWLDTTYLSHSGNLRISRGNKGTTFVLQKKTEPRQILLSAISTSKGVEEAIDKLISLNQSNRPSNEDETELQEGQWEMIWSSQTETDSWIENAANGLMGMQIVKKNGQIKFLVDILLGFKFSITGTYVKSGSNTYDVNMDDAAILWERFGYPIEIDSKFNLQVLCGFVKKEDVDLYRKLVVGVAWQKQMPKFTILLSLSDKMSELLERVSQTVKRYNEEFLNTAMEAYPKLSKAHFHRASILHQLCRQKIM